MSVSTKVFWSTEFFKCPLTIDLFIFIQFLVRRPISSFFFQIRNFYPCICIAGMDFSVVWSYWLVKRKNDLAWSMFEISMEKHLVNDDRCDDQALFPTSSNDGVVDLFRWLLLLLIWFCWGCELFLYYSLFSGRLETLGWRINYFWSQIFTPCFHVLHYTSTFLWQLHWVRERERSS